jgi:NAD(P)H-dependent FMN reductase
MGEVSEPPHLLIVWHSRTGASEQMAHAAHEGACEAAPGSLLLCANEVSADVLLAAAAYLFVCPENLGSMSGLMKEMFDRTYYDVLGRIEGRAYASIIAAGSDGQGAQRQLDRILTGWRLRRVADPMIVNFAAQTPEAIVASKQVDDNTLNSCQDLGQGLAEGANLGLF